MRRWGISPESRSTRRAIWRSPTRATGLVERVNADGTLSIIAGNGLTLGVHTGDGGPAVNAALNGLYGVAYDSQGNLYIAESDRLSRVSPQGIINTIAGGGTDAVSNGIPALQAVVSPVQFRRRSRRRCFRRGLLFRVLQPSSPEGYAGRNDRTVAGTGAAGFSGDGGPAAAARLYAPLGLALDGTGNLYIADNGNLRVRKVTPAGVISTAPSRMAMRLVWRLTATASFIWWAEAWCIRRRQVLQARP